MQLLHFMELLSKLLVLLGSLELALMSGVFTALDFHKMELKNGN